MRLLRRGRRCREREREMGGGLLQAGEGWDEWDEWDVGYDTTVVVWIMDLFGDWCNYVSCRLVYCIEWREGEKRPPFAETLALILHHFILARALPSSSPPTSRPALNRMTIPVLTRRRLSYSVTFVSDLDAFPSKRRVPDAQNAKFFSLPYTPKTPVRGKGPPLHRKKVPEPF